MSDKVVVLYPLAYTIQSINLGKEIKIVYHKDSPSGFVGTHSDASAEEARPEFYDAIAEVIPHALQICELDGLIEPSGIKITSISFASGKFKVSMCRDLGEDRMWNFSTPAVKEEEQSEELQQVLERVAEEDNKYIAGQRAQLSLLEGAA